MGFESRVVSILTFRGFSSSPKVCQFQKCVIQFAERTKIECKLREANAIQTYIMFLFAFLAEFKLKLFKFLQ